MLPAPELRPWILHYWMVDWDLPPGVRHVVETMPHPNVQLVFDSAGAHVHGVHPRKFTKVLEGRESVFGVKFRAAGFRPFAEVPAADLYGKTVPACRIFRNTPLPAPPLSVDAANVLFLAIKPSREPEPHAVEAVEAAESDPEIRTVAALAERVGLSGRTLQRLFHEHVGVSPKWVIRRYRMHELVERLNAAAACGSRLEWAGLAVELGYFDQSHLIRDFRLATGYSPESYLMDRSGS